MVRIGRGGVASPVAWTVLAAALGSPGCSLVFVTPPPSAPATAGAAPSPPQGGGPAPECTTGVAWPIVDAVLAAAAVANTAHEATRTNVDAYDRWLQRGAIVTFGLGALVAGGSAYYGFSRTAACRQARAARVGPPGRSAPAPLSLSTKR